MTDLVSLLFIAMIPIDFKITNFSLHLFVYFFLYNYNMLVNSQAPLQMKECPRILFSRVPHPLINEKFIMPVSFVFALTLALLHSAIDRIEHEKYLFLPSYGKMENPIVTVQDQLVTVKSERAITLRVQCCLTIYKTI